MNSDELAEIEHLRYECRQHMRSIRVCYREARNSKDIKSVSDIEFHSAPDFVCDTIRGLRAEIEGLKIERNVIGNKLIESFNNSCNTRDENKKIVQDLGSQLAEARKERDDFKELFIKANDDKFYYAGIVDNIAGILKNQQEVK